jgi:hypothetical protein
VAVSFIGGEIGAQGDDHKPEVKTGVPEVHQVSGSVNIFL